jgi:hypothetical protein
VNKRRIRAALAALLALAASPDGFTVADMTAKVHAMTGQAPLFEHPAAELSADDSAQLCEDRRRPGHVTADVA